MGILLDLNVLISCIFLISCSRVGYCKLRIGQSGSIWLIWAFRIGRS